MLKIENNIDPDKEIKIITEEKTNEQLKIFKYISKKIKKKY